MITIIDSLFVWVTALIVDINIVMKNMFKWGNWSWKMIESVIYVLDVSQIGALDAHEIWRIFSQ